MGEIGSFYEENKILTKEPHHMELIEQCLNNGYKDYCMLSCGREGFMMALSNIVKESAKRPLKCLLPMYTCDTVVMPFENYGCDISFYPVGKNLRPDKTTFETLIESLEIDVLVIHSYYGVDTLSQVRSVIKEFRRRGGIVIEDLTQCFFMEPDYMADYYVVSLRKWSGIADGGLIISKYMLTDKPTQERKEFVDTKLRAISEKTEYLNGVNPDNYTQMQQLKQEFLQLNNKAEEMLDLDLTPFVMSKVSKETVSGFDFHKAKEIRACNAKFLSENMVLEHPIEYTGKEAPIYFPIYIKNREQFQQFMRERNIFIPVLWLLYESIGDIDADTRYIYDNILALPCDHRYSRQDMERMLMAIEEYQKNI